MTAPASPGYEWFPMNWRRTNRFRCEFRGLFVLILVLTTLAGGQAPESAEELVREFKTSPDCFRQFDVARKLVKLHDAAVLKPLEPFLRDDDRHLRGNAAFVFAELGDQRGFEVIQAILQDRSSDRPRGQSVSGNWSLEGQITSDRYYAAHLLGDLKDKRAVPILIPLLKDPQVNWIVPWALGEIGDRTAIPPLIQTLADRSPDMRVLAIYTLGQLGAKEALPQLQELTADDAHIHFDGLGTVADAAKSAISKLKAKPSR